MPSDVDDQPKAKASPANKPKKKRRWLKSLAIFVVCLLIGLAILPTVLGMGILKSVAESQVNPRIQGTLAIDSIKIGWFKPLAIRGVRLTDDSGATLLDAQTIDAPGASLIGLIQSQGKRMELLVDGVQANAKQNAQGQWDWQTALASAPGSGAVASKQQSASTDKKGNPSPSQTPSTPDVQWPDGFAAIAKLTNARVSVQPSGEPKPFVFDLSDATVDAQDPADLRVLAHGQWAEAKKQSQAKSGNDGGTLLVEASVVRLFDDQGKMQPVAADVSADVLLDRWPLALASLAGQDVQLIQTLAQGDAATVSLHASGHASDLVANVSVTCGQAVAGTLAVGFDGQRLQLASPSIWTVNVTPQSLAAVTDTQLDAPVTLTAELSRLQLPLKDGQPDIDALALDAKLALSPVSQNVPDVGQIGLQDTVLTLHSPAIARRLEATLGGQPAINGQAGRLQLSASIDDLFAAQPGLGVQADIEHMPLAPIADGLLSLDGLLTQAFGPNFNLSVAVEPAAHDANVVAVSDALPLATSDENTNTPSNNPADAWLAAGDWSVRLNSGAWQANANGQWTSDAVEVAASSFEGKLPSKAWDALMAQPWFASTAASLEGARLNGPVVLAGQSQGGLPLNGQWQDADWAGWLTINNLGLKETGAARVARQKQAIAEADAAGLPTPAIGPVSWAVVGLDALKIECQPGLWANGKTVSVAATLTDGKRSAQVNAQTQLDVADGENGSSVPIVALASANASISEVPVTWLEDLSGQPGKLQPHLGNLVEAITIQCDPQTKQGVAKALALSPMDRFVGRVSWSMNTSRSQGQGALALLQSDGGWQVALADGQPLTMLVQVDGQNLEAIKAQVDEDSSLKQLTLLGKGDLVLSLPTLEAIWSSEQSALASMQAKVSASLGGVRLKDQAGNVLALEDLLATATLKDVTSPIQIDVDAKQAGVQAPLLALHGQLDNALPPSLLASKQGVVANNPTVVTKPIAFTGQFDAKQVPLALVDGLANSNGLLPRTLGDVVDVHWSGEWPNVSDLKVTSSAVVLTTQVDAKVDQATGQLAQVVLPQGLSIDFELLNLGNNALLGELHPVFELVRQTSVVNMQPFALRLDPNTTIDLQNISLEQLALAGSLDLGTIAMTKEDDLVGVMMGYANQMHGGLTNAQMQDTLKAINQGLKLAGEKPLPWIEDLQDPGNGQNAATSKARMTPIRFALKDGQFTTDQSWLSTRGVNLGFQGKTDLVAGKVDYRLGVPGQTLIKMQDEWFGDVFEPARIYEFALGGDLGGNLSLKSEALQGFVQQALQSALNQKLKEEGLDLTRFGVDDQTSDAIGGLLGGLLGGNRPAPPRRATGGSTPNAADTATNKADAPRGTVDWQLPAGLG